MPKKKPAKAPAVLAEAGTRLWERVVKDYTLRVDELRILEAACQTTDTIAGIDKTWNELGQPYLTTGSTGQDVVHPLIGERRAQQAQLAKLLAQLKLPDLGEAIDGETATNPARAAAATRWKHGS